MQLFNIMKNQHNCQHMEGGLLYCQNAKQDIPKIDCQDKMLRVEDSKCLSCDHADRKHIIEKLLTKESLNLVNHASSIQHSDQAKVKVETVNILRSLMHILYPLNLTISDCLLKQELFPGLRLTDEILSAAAQPVLFLEHALIDGIFDQEELTDFFQVILNLLVLGTQLHLTTCSDASADKVKILVTKIQKLIK